MEEISPSDSQFLLIKQIIDPFKIFQNSVKASTICKKILVQEFRAEAVQVLVSKSPVIALDEVYVNEFGELDGNYKVKINLTVSKACYEPNNIKIHEAILFDTFNSIHECILYHLFGKNKNIKIFYNSLKETPKDLNFKYLREMDEHLFKYKHLLKINNKAGFNEDLLECLVREACWDIFTADEIAIIKTTPPDLISSALDSVFETYEDYLENEINSSLKSGKFKSNGLEIYKPFYKKEYEKVLLEL